MSALARGLIIHDPSNKIIIHDPLNLIIYIESIKNNSKFWVTYLRDMIG